MSLADMFLACCSNYSALSVYRINNGISMSQCLLLASEKSKPPTYFISFTMICISSSTRNTHNHRNDAVIEELKFFNSIACRSFHFLGLDQEFLSVNYFSPIIIIQFISGVLQKHHLCISLRTFE